MSGRSARLRNCWVELVAPSEKREDRSARVGTTTGPAVDAERATPATVERPFWSLCGAVLSSSARKERLQRPPRFATRDVSEPHAYFVVSAVRRYGAAGPNGQRRTVRHERRECYRREQEQSPHQSSGYRSCGSAPRIRAYPTHAKLTHYPLAKTKLAQVTNALTTSESLSRAAARRGHPAAR
jgi:hypothetical protein